MQAFSVMKTEAAKAGFKAKWIWQLLIFLPVFFVTELYSSTLLLYIFVFYFISNPGIFTAIAAADINAVQAIVQNNSSWIVMAELAVTVFELLIPIIYCTKIEKRSLRSMGFIKKNAGKYYLTGLILGAVQLSLALGITCLLGGAEIRLSTEIPVLQILLFFVLYMIQGAGEEVMVRGYLMMSLQNSIKGKKSGFWAVALSALVFAALHLSNPGITPLAFFNLFLSGITFGVLVMRTDSIFCAAAMHTSWNFVQGNIFGVLVSGMPMSASVFTTSAVGPAWKSGAAFGLEGGIGTTLAELAAIALILIFIPEKEPDHPEKLQ